MVIPGIAGEYATSFFRESYQRGADRVCKAFEVELNVLTLSVRGDEDWNIATTSPFVSKEAKEEYMKTKCKELKLSPFFTNRLLTLLEKDDLGRLEQIRADYEEIMRIYRRERTVTLVTGPGYSQQEIDLLKNSVKVNYLSASDTMVFNHQVDNSILGGMKVSVDGTIYDNTWNDRTVESINTEEYTKALGTPKPKVTPQEITERELKRFGLTSIDRIVPIVDAETPKQLADLYARRRKRPDLALLLMGNPLPGEEQAHH